MAEKQKNRQPECSIRNLVGWKTGLVMAMDRVFNCEAGEPVTGTPVRSRGQVFRVHFAFFLLFRVRVSEPRNCREGISFRYDL